MKIKLNSKDEELNIKTINDLLKLKNIEKNGLVILINDDVIKDDNYDIYLKENDIVELLSFVSGG